MAWNLQLPLPAGAAGADPATLAAAGQALGAAIQPGMPDINTLAAMGGQGHLYPSDYLLGIGLQEEAITTRFTAQEQRLLDEFDATNKRLEEAARLDYEAAIESAGIYAAASEAAAAAGAEAQKYAADQSLAAAQARARAAIEVANIAAAASRYDSDTRLKIAKMTVDLERQRIAAVELARPSDWAARVGFFRGQTPEQAQALTQYAGGTVFGGQMPGAQTTLPQLPSATSAIVGEAGPELMTATPQGAQISPLQAEQAQWLRGQGVPGMQGGGTIRRDWKPTQKIGPAAGRGGYQAGGKSPTEMATANWERRTAGAHLRRSAAIGGPLSSRDLFYAAQGRMPAPHEMQGFRAAYPSIGGLTPHALKGPGGGTWSRPSSAEALQLRQRVRQAEGGGAGEFGPGFATPGAALPTGDTVTPVVVPEAPIDQLPFLQAARAGGQFPVAPFQEWTGPTTKPEIGITTPVPPPWTYNIVQFQNMTRAEQAMLAATWRSMNMIPGETEEEMIANAYNAMGRSAWTGANIPALTQYGGW